MKKLAIVVGLLLTAACSKQAVRPDEQVQATRTPPPAARPASEPVAEQPKEEAPAPVAAAPVTPPAGPLAPPTVRFEFNSFHLSQEARTALDAFAAQYSGKQAPALTIEGHADERGTEEFNLVLGERRAAAVRKYLARLGLKEGKLKTVSYGEQRPANGAHDEEAWAQNRRAEVKVKSAGK